jgi:hypothetical protein
VCVQNLNSMRSTVLNHSGTWSLLCEVLSFWKPASFTPIPEKVSPVYFCTIFEYLNPCSFLLGCCVVVEF